MRNYVIINGVNSLTIQGLAINTLPPITKPMIRTQREEIDGRDGDIVTELGYSAYDKQIEIGLWGTYDINDIIKYFTGEGTIVFSNEEDKYYNFKILDQIDYQKLLKFKTATITFHCQPFKYPLEEEPVEAEITTLTGTGTTLTLNNTEEAPMSLVYKGNTQQSGTPTPDNPIPIQVVSGDNSIVVCGKNLAPTDWASKFVSAVNNTNQAKLETKDGRNCLYYSANAGYGSYPTKNFTLGMTFKENTQYTISYDILKESTNRNTIAIRYTDGTESSNTNVSAIDTWEHQTITSTAGKTIDYLAPYYTSGYTYIDLNTWQIEEGTTATTYEAYTGESYPISLGDIELCKIGTYQDKIDKSSGKNLFNPQDFITAMSTHYREIKTINGVEFICLGRSQSTTTTYTYSLNCKENTQYTLSFKYISNACSLTVSYSDGTSSSGLTPNKTTLTDVSYTSVANKTITGITLYCGGWYASGNKLEITQIMLNEGTTVLEYEPYGTGWYVKKEIGKYTFTGNEVYTKSGLSDTTYFCGYCDQYNYQVKEEIGYINKFKIGSYATITNEECMRVWGQGQVRILASRLSENSATACQNWFKTQYDNGTPVIVYYPLNTPTYTEITDSTLINQLETIKKSYEGQTNISQTNNDLPFELDVSVTFLTPMEINNIGNIYAKPILTIEGTGNIGVVLNDIQILDIDLTNNGKIAIDVPKLEAYNPDDDTLLNRLVTGDYMKLLINEGENTITFTGNVSGATLTNYIRWI